jgi:hypothetical protein
MRKFRAKFVEKIKTHILCSVSFFPPENSAVYEIQYCSAGQATDDNMAHALFLLDT